MIKRKVTSPLTWSLTALVVLAWYSSAGISTAAGQPPTGTLVEEFSFHLKDLKMDHQGEVNNLNITVHYRYKANITDSEYPDFRPVAKDVENFLANYPNKKDYWDILNKKITLMILNNHPLTTKVTCQIQVSPSPLVPYLRSSIVTRERTPAKTPSAARIKNR